MQPPTLLSLTIDSALRHIAHIADLSAIPDPIVLELFWLGVLVGGFVFDIRRPEDKTLQAGKLTEKVLKLFMATGNEDILSFVHRLNIKPTLTPVLPTSWRYGEARDIRVLGSKASCGFVGNCDDLILLVLHGKERIECDLHALSLAEFLDQYASTAIPSGTFVIYVCS